VATPVSVVVKFSDTGLGNSGKRHPHALRQNENHDRWAQSGLEAKTGLGLPICRGTIEAHGGAISVESKEGKGTTLPSRFRFRTA